MKRARFFFAERHPSIVAKEGFYGDGFSDLFTD
jgi:hypothetical protein